MKAQANNWINFYAPNGVFLCGYTVRGTFPGEIEATIECIAQENGLQPEDIIVRQEPKYKN